MNKTDSTYGKTPLEYCERAIEELRRAKEELQDELENIKASNVQGLESSIKFSQTEIHSLKSELQLTKEKLESAEITAIKAEKAAHDAQAKIQNFKDSLPESTINFQIIEELAEIKGQLSQLLQTNQKYPENDLQKEILESLSSLRSQFSQLEAELTLISPNSGINYTKLRDLLAENKWQEADKETCLYMLRISDREDESWLDDGEIKKLSRHDLRIINNLWLKYSDGKFGFSVQKQIWQDSREDFKRFGDRVGWLINLVDSEWRRYENAIFSLDAPAGHFPYTVKIVGLGYRSTSEIPHRLKLFLKRY